MANVRLSMRKIVEVRRLYHEGGRSHREIARMVNTSPTTVGEILRRTKRVGSTYLLQRERGKSIPVDQKAKGLRIP